MLSPWRTYSIKAPTERAGTSLVQPRCSEPYSTPAVDAARVLLESKCDVLAVNHESETLLHRAALPRDINTTELLAETRYTLRTVNVKAKNNSSKTAKQRLETVEPSAELLKAFTAMLRTVESARQCEINQYVFKDANQYQSGGSPTLSCSTTDSEELSAIAYHHRRSRLSEPPRQVSRNWASKY